MSTTQSTIDFLLEQLSNAGSMRARKMFGEYALYCDEKVVAFVCDDQLYVKPTEIEQDFAEFYEKAPAYPGSKLYNRVDAEKWEDAAWLCDFIRQTANVLPLPKPKN